MSLCKITYDRYMMLERLEVFDTDLKLRSACRLQPLSFET